MKKTIKLNESQLNKLIDDIINEDGNVPRAYTEHWENKFEKSVEVLLKIGHNPNDLIKRIEIITNKSNHNQSSINENFKINGHEFNCLKFENQSIYVGDDGILGDNHIFIPWGIIEKLLKKYNANN